MKFDEILKKRKSVRAYLDKEVSKEVFDKMIEAAKTAPSGGNSQPTRYKVLGKEMIKNLKEAEVFEQDWIYGVSHIVVCCGDMNAYHKGIKDSEKELREKVNESYKKRYVDDRRTRVSIDVAISSSYLVLKATELGLGTCYVGWFKEGGEERMRKLLGLGEEYIIPFVVVVGYGDGDVKDVDRVRKDDIVEFFE